MLTLMKAALCYRAAFLGKCWIFLLYIQNLTFSITKMSKMYHFYHFFNHFMVFFTENRQNTCLCFSQKQLFFRPCYFGSSIFFARIFRIKSKFVYLYILFCIFKNSRNKALLYVFIIISGKYPSCCTKHTAKC